MARTSWGTITGASSATPRLAAMITRPIGATRLRTTRHSPQRPAAVTPSGVVAATLAVADARIDPRIEDVDDQVGYDEQQGNHQDHTLHDRIIPLEDRLKHQPPHPRQGED